MKNHHYPETKTRRYDLLSLFLFENQIEQRHDSQSYFAAVHGPSNPFQKDFDVNAIDMLGLKAQAIQEGVQYAFGVFQSESPAKIFIRGKKMFCWPSFLYRRKFISNFSRVAEGYCSGVTDPVKPFWQAELKQL